MSQKRRRIFKTREIEFGIYDLDGPVQDDISLLPLSYNRNRRVGSYMMRMQPGAVTVAHEHRYREEFFVLEGHLIDDDETIFGPGDFVWFEQGTYHNSRTEDGCLLLVIEWDDK